MRSPIVLRNFLTIELLYAAGGALLTWLLLSNGWSPFDDGVYGWSARRMLDGAVPHRDFIAHHPGYALYLDMWLYRLFGTDLVVLRYPLPLIAATLVGLIAWLARPAGRAVQAACAIFATGLGVIQFITPSPGWYATALAAASLSSLYLACTINTRRHTALLLLAGILLGVCGGFRQFNGAALGAGLVILRALIVSPTALVPGRLNQVFSLVVLIGAILVVVIPALLAPSVSSLLLTLPMVVCAVYAGSRWKKNLAVRDARWLLPLIGGCALGFMPILVPAAMSHALPAFFADTVLDAVRYNGYSSVRELSFGIQVTDALEAISMGGVYPLMVSVYLVTIAVMPAWLAYLLCTQRNELEPHLSAISVLAGISLLNSLVFQGLLYSFFWLPSVGAAILVLSRRSHGRRGLFAMVSLVAIALFGAIFHAGRIPGASWQDILGKPFFPQTACAIPGCSLRVNPILNTQLLAAYQDLVEQVPSQNPLLLMPTGADLYALLPHRAPWSISYVLEGFTPEEQLSRLQTEFQGTPSAVLAVTTEYGSTPGPDTGLDRLIASVCLQKQTRLHRFYKVCPSTTVNARPPQRPAD